jgi:hypothetical protein
MRLRRRSSPPGSRFAVVGESGDAVEDGWRHRVAAVPGVIDGDQARAATDG